MNSKARSEIRRSSPSWRRRLRVGNPTSSAKHNDAAQHDAKFHNHLDTVPIIYNRQLAQQSQIHRKLTMRFSRRENPHDRSNYQPNTKPKHGLRTLRIAPLGTRKKIADRSARDGLSHKTYEATGVRLTALGARCADSPRAACANHAGPQTLSEHRVSARLRCPGDAAFYVSTCDRYQPHARPPRCCLRIAPTA